MSIYFLQAGWHDEAKTKYHFFFPFQTGIPLSEHLRNLKDTFENMNQGKGEEIAYFLCRKSPEDFPYQEVVIEL